jgi:hypothetical protein
MEWMARMNIDTISDMYDVSGIAFQSGLKAGNFYAPNNSSAPGVPVGLSVPYLIENPASFSITSPLLTQTVPIETSVYLKLGNITAFPIKEITSSKVDRGVVFDYPRTIEIRTPDTVTSPFTVTVSMYNMYNQKMSIFQNSTVLPGKTYSSVLIQACKTLVSVLLNNRSTSSNVAFSVIPTNFFELPFNDLGSFGLFDQNISKTATGNIIPNLSTNSADAPYLIIPTNSNPNGNGYIPAVKLNQVLDQTQMQGSRPLYYIEPFNGNATYMFSQFVYGLGNSKPPLELIDEATYQNKINTSEVTTGLIPSFDLFTEWKG